MVPFYMGRLPRRNLGAGVYHIYNRCANNLWILDSRGRCGNGKSCLKFENQRFSGRMKIL